MALSLSIILSGIIAAASANIRLERCHFCHHPILRPTLLTLEDRAEAELSKEPWVDPFQQGLTEIAVPGCSGRAAVMVDRLSLVYFYLVALASHYGRNRYLKHLKIDN
jgi:hypothetical protein